MIAMGILATGAARAQTAGVEVASAEAPVELAAVDPGGPGGAGAPPISTTAAPNTPPKDQGVSPKKKAAERRETKLPWRGTSFDWTNRVTAQTLGIGQDYQSSNPYYEWVFSLRPRYYVWEDGNNTLSLRATLSAYTELTNSDSTTKEHELLIDDSTIALVSSFTLAKDGEYKTVLTLSAPRYVIPTSKSSRASGIYGELGARAGIAQTLPIRDGEAYFSTATLGFRTSYGYLLSNANVAVDSDLNRPRQDVNGDTVPNDQLGAATLAQHRATAHVSGSVDIYRDVVSFSTEVGMDFFWKFPLLETEVMTATGPTEIPNQDSGRLHRSTFFNVDLSVVAIHDILTVGTGFESVPTQLGAGGKRRSLFYNPDALFYVALELSLDGLYLEASGEQGPSEVASGR